MADHHHIAGNDLVGQNAGDRGLLAFEYPRPPAEGPDRLVDARRLDDAALGDAAL